jgi:hypothetical protein
VDLVITDVSEESGASIIRVARLDELGTTSAITSNRRTLRGNTTVGSYKSHTANIPEGDILQFIPYWLILDFYL